MQYGYFDNEHREYVITDPRTPAAWANYLGSPAYGAIISNNAGGYSFARSGADGRILKYFFNDADEPGRYLYIKDDKSGDFWSASWLPVKKPLDQYKIRCRHGLAYTVMEADYADIHSEALYYVPLEAEYEVWALKVRNDGASARSLTLTGYAEFTNHNNYEQDQINTQYSRFVTCTKMSGQRIRQLVHGNLDIGEEVDSHEDFVERFFGLAGAPVAGFCGDKDAFIGRYRGYGDPAGVAEGLNGEMNYCDVPCGALAAKVVLQSGEEKIIAFILGMHKDAVSKEIVARYEQDTAALVQKEWDALKAHWGDRLSALQIHTPSPELDTMINTWNAYNCFMTFIWSRAASFVYCGLRNGYGYRDTVQDIQGVIHLKPEMAAEQIRFMLSAQVHHGAGLPLVKFTHNAGHEDTPEDDSYVRATGHPAYRADDALWLFPTVYKYIAESGNVAFLDEVIPFADQDEGTVYEHLKRAIDFTMHHLGPHGMPAGLHADWNDCLRLGAQGESTFVAFQFYYALRLMQEFAAHEKDEDYIAFLKEEQEKLGTILNDLCWNEDRFIRGFKEDGEVIGRRDDPEANMWLNPQSWSVISGLASPEQAETGLQTAHDRLNTDYGLVIMDPPYQKHSFEGALMVIFNAGCKENGGIFSQTQGWIILAEALMGHGDRAFTYFMENAPVAQNDRAEIRKLEPYCYGQFTEGKTSPHLGRSHVHWLTGTASTMMVGCVEGILGLRPDLGGLKIAPSIPAAWDSFTMEKTFRGKKLSIRVENPDHVQSGCKSLTVNGAAIKGNYIPETVLKDTNDIVLVL